MAEKDIVEKTLEAYNDVFADIVNVLLFDGKEIIDENDLVDMATISCYKADGKLHEQDRDVSKFWNKSNVHIALLGLENQTDIDKDMPLRIISYDGAAYRAQLLDKKNKNRYPVVTLVLYFGNEPWNKHKNLCECFDIPEVLKPFVNDYKLNLFDIPRLDIETVRKFKSDFRIVAEYFTQLYQTNDYIPERETIDHVHEVLQLLAVFSQDDRFETAFNELQIREVKNMSEFWDRVESRGISIGEARAAKRYEAELKARDVSIAAQAAENAALKAQIAELLAIQAAR